MIILSLLLLSCSNKTGEHRGKEFPRFVAPTDDSNVDNRLEKLNEDIFEEASQKSGLNSFSAYEELPSFIAPSADESGECDASWLQESNLSQDANLAENNNPVQLQESLILKEEELSEDTMSFSIGRTSESDPLSLDQQTGNYEEPSKAQYDQQAQQELMEAVLCLSVDETLNIEGKARLFSLLDSSVSDISGMPKYKLLGMTLDDEIIAHYPNRGPEILTGALEKIDALMARCNGKLEVLARIIPYMDNLFSITYLTRESLINLDISKYQNIGRYFNFKGVESASLLHLLFGVLSAQASLSDVSFLSSFSRLAEEKGKSYLIGEIDRFLKTWSLEIFSDDMQRVISLIESLARRGLMDQTTTECIRMTLQRAAEYDMSGFAHNNKNYKPDYLFFLTFIYYFSEMVSETIGNGQGSNFREIINSLSRANKDRIQEIYNEGANLLAGKE